jgi:hypothetical protein
MDLQQRLPMKFHLPVSLSSEPFPYKLWRKKILGDFWGKSLGRMAGRMGNISP